MPIAPIGTVIHLAGDEAGSWLKINHRTDVPTRLLVKHFEDSATALTLLKAARTELATPTEQRQVLLDKIDALLKSFLEQTLGDPSEN